MDEAEEFLGNLKTEATSGRTGRRVKCSDLSAPNDYESATVSLDSIRDAIADTFGVDAGHRTERIQHLLVVTSAKGDGIRPSGKSGRKRKDRLSDEIDKYSDGFYASGTGGSRGYFLRQNRLEGDELTAPKPVFDGCDAHSFGELRAGLGKHVTDPNARRNITWIKADPTYDGLLQTLIEPAERVAIQAQEPDQKEPYRVIQRVTFADNTDFPAEILLNRNLNSIIGSRSSGKSALLAFISHAVDPIETVRIQVDSAGLQDESKAGPAAGRTWDDVSEVRCQVEWLSGASTTGKVIYIPQNSLYGLSEQPEEITKKIAPALFRTYPTVKIAFDNAMRKTATAKAEVRAAIDEWFGLADRIDQRDREIRDLGDRTAIAAERDRLQEEIERIKTSALLTDDEVAEYQKIAQKLDRADARLKAISVELDQLSTYVDLPAGAVVPDLVQATVTIRPSAVEVPAVVAGRIDEIRIQATQKLVTDVESALVTAAGALETERGKLATESLTVKVDDAELIAKHESNAELADVVGNHKKQIVSLEEIGKLEKSRSELVGLQKAAAAKVSAAIKDRDDALATLETTFMAEDRLLTDLKFGLL